MKRRAALATLAVGMLGALAPVAAAAQARRRTTPDRPDPALFQTGDFVWPKTPGAYVPYDSGSTNDPDQDRTQWTTERSRYIAQASSAAPSDRLVAERIARLRALNFREFHAIYAGDQRPGFPGVYGGGAFYVGHVGIIELGAGKAPSVIEAVKGRVKQVRRIAYADWVRERPNDAVWLGRLNDVRAAERARVAAEAARYVGRPYDFWNFDLDDDAGFYCSKLAWLAVYRTLRFAVDDNPDPKRSLWFSPKQFLNVPRIRKLHEPGPYSL